MKKILDTVGSFLIIAITAFILLLTFSNKSQVKNGAVIPMNFGWGTATVVSGSMEPGIPIGSLLLIQKQAEYRPGEVVAYANNEGQAITHRIVSITDGTIITRGDSNSMSDPAFPEEQIIGKVRYILPSVGAVLMFMKQPVVLGTLALISFIIYLIPNPLQKKKTAPESTDTADIGI